MDPENKFPQFTHLDWDQLGYFDHINPVNYDFGPNLNIHPLFANANWARQRWTMVDGEAVNITLSEEEYNERELDLEPALLMASGILLSPGKHNCNFYSFPECFLGCRTPIKMIWCNTLPPGIMTYKAYEHGNANRDNLTASLDFIYHVTHSRRRRLWKEYKGRQCSEILTTPLTTPKEERRQLARDVLNRLAPVTEFRVELQSNFPAMQGAHGLTTPTHVHAPNDINVKSDDGPATGMACATRINHDDLERLDQLRAERGERNRDSSPDSRHVSRNDMAIRFRLQFKLAVTICHEVAHAIGLAVDEEYLAQSLKERARMVADKSYKGQVISTNEPYVGRDPIAELGYA